MAEIGDEGWRRGTGHDTRRALVFLGRRHGSRLVPRRTRVSLVQLVVCRVRRVVRPTILRVSLTFLQYFGHNSFVTTLIDFILVALEI